jgi:hypothetical protein
MVEDSSAEVTLREAAREGLAATRCRVAKVRREARGDFASAVPSLAMLR